MSGELVKTKKSVMLNKAVVQREELLNAGYAHEMAVLLLRFLKSVFYGAGTLVGQYRSI